MLVRVYFGNVHVLEVQLKVSVALRYRGERIFTFTLHRQQGLPAACDKSLFDRLLPSFREHLLPGLGRLLRLFGEAKGHVDEHLALFVFLRGPARIHRDGTDDPKSDMGMVFLHLDPRLDTALVHHPANPGPLLGPDRFFPVFETTGRDWR